MKQGIHPNYVDCTITCFIFFSSMIMRNRREASIREP